MAHNNSPGTRTLPATRRRSSSKRCGHLLSFLPQNNLEDPPRVPAADDPQRTAEALVHLVPTVPSKPYDMRDLIGQVADRGEFLEVHHHFAQNIVVGFARLNGRSWESWQSTADHGWVFGHQCVGQGRPFRAVLRRFQRAAGHIGGRARVPARFRAGARRVIRHGAKLLFAYSEATVPRSRSSSASRTAEPIWPCAPATWGRTSCSPGRSRDRGDGSEGAANIIFRREIREAADPEARRQEMIEEYRRNFSIPTRPPSAAMWMP